MKIRIINGPNLNLLGSREPSTYGTRSFDSFYVELQDKFPQVKLDHFQSNIEGELIDALHKAATICDGIILNAAAYTHTSVGLGDAVAAIQIPVVEVHISNTQAREPFRHVSYIAPHARGIITGFGLKSYELAIRSFLE